MTEPSAPFDRRLLDRRQARWLLPKPENGADFLLQAVTGELIDRLSIVERHFEIAVDLVGHGGSLADRLEASGQCGRVLRLERLAGLLGDGAFGVVGDDEFLPLAPDSVDLIVSTLSLQFVNDVPGTLAQIRRTLKPDGLFFAAFLGGDTLHELRASLIQAEAETIGGASPRVLPFVDIREAGALLQRAGFALPVTDLDRLTVRYDNLFALARDLRQMGAANMLRQRTRRPASRAMFLRAAEIYAERFADPDGRIRATFDVIYLSGWCPHESQQKPLRPGSAKHSLAEALQDRSGTMS